MLLGGARTVGGCELDGLTPYLYQKTLCFRLSQISNPNLPHKINIEFRFIEFNKLNL